MLPRLTSLELLDCPLTQEESYRDKLFEMLPSLQVIDGFNRSGDEVESDDEEEEEEEEEEVEEEGDSGSDDEPGLSYLAQTLNSVSISSTQTHFLVAFIHTILCTYWLQLCIIVCTHIPTSA